MGHSLLSLINSIVPAYIWTVLIPLLVYAGWFWVVRHFRGTFLDCVAGRALIVGVGLWPLWIYLYAIALPMLLSEPLPYVPPSGPPPYVPPPPLTLLWHLVLSLAQLVVTLFGVLWELGNTLDHSDAGKILPVLFLIWLAWVVVSDIETRLGDLERRVDRLDDLERARTP